MATEVRETRTTNIQDVIDQVKNELARARSQAPDLKLKEFRLELSVVAERSGSVGVVVKGELGDSITHKITLTYEAPPAVMGIDRLPEVKLAEALRTIQQSVKAGQNREPKLNFKSGEVSLEFVVTKLGGIEFSFGPVNVGGQYKREESNTVTLTFEV